MGWEKVAIGILVVSSFFIFWFASEESSFGKTVFIDRVIDGDTLQIVGGEKIRLLGINTPESGMFFYEEAKNFTKILAEGKSLILESSETDRYGRELGYIFDKKDLINEIILKEGFAHLYYYGEDEYYSRLKSAEEKAREDEKGIWKHSENYGCVSLVEFVYLDLTEKEKEKLVLKNICDKTLFLTIKDDATHIYEEKIPAGNIFEKETQNIWNDDGDSIYVWDDDGLIFFYRYS